MPCPHNLYIQDGGGKREVNVIVAVYLSVCRSVSSITHERVYGHRLNMVSPRDDPLELIKFWCLSWGRDRGTGGPWTPIIWLGATMHLPSPPIFGTWISYFSPKLSAKRLCSLCICTVKYIIIAFWNCCDSLWPNAITSACVNEAYRIPNTAVRRARHVLVSTDTRPCLKQEAQLSQRDRATHRVIEYFANISRLGFFYKNRAIKIHCY